MSLKNLVEVKGSLDETATQLDVNTIQHADEITSQHQIKKAFRDSGHFWTADFPLYHVEGEEVALYLARGKDNLIFKNLEDAITQLMDHGYYTPKNEEAEAVIKQESTLKIRLSRLHLDYQDTDFEGSFSIDAAHLNKLNKDERAFAERVYGQGQAFVKNMERVVKLRRGINRSVRRRGVSGQVNYLIQALVLNPDHVKMHAKENGFLAQPGTLFYSDYIPYFKAYSDYWKDFRVSFLTRYPTKRVEYERALDLVLKNPQALNPERVSKLQKLLDNYKK